LWSRSRFLRDVQAADGGGIRYADGGDKAETCNGAVLLPFCLRRQPAHRVVWGGDCRRRTGYFGFGIQLRLFGDLAPRIVPANVTPKWRFALGWLDPNAYRRGAPRQRSSARIIGLLSQDQLSELIRISSGS
jgi:hypothetical protein